MYYSNSDVKATVESWYNTNITADNTTKVATGNHFCEAAKTKYSNDLGSGNATMVLYSSYTPDLKCETDGNSKGLVNNSVGLIYYYEVILAGGYYNSNNNDYYLYKNHYWWTMSPGGFNSVDSYVWDIYPSGKPVAVYVDDGGCLRPVINIKKGVFATGSGTASDPYIILGNTNNNNSNNNSGGDNYEALQ